MPRSDENSIPMVAMGYCAMSLATASLLLSACRSEKIVYDDYQYCGGSKSDHKQHAALLERVQELRTRRPKEEFIGPLQLNLAETSFLQITKFSNFGGFSRFLIVSTSEEISASSNDGLVKCPMDNQKVNYNVLDETAKAAWITDFENQFNGSLVATEPYETEFRVVFAKETETSRLKSSSPLQDGAP